MENKALQLTSADILELKRSVYRSSLYDFVKAAWSFLHPGTPLKLNWHLEAICDHLQAQSQGDKQRLIINLPPGAGKSLSAGVFWPCWEWSHSPHVQILATAANEDLAKRDNQKARWLLDSPWYQELFPLALKNDSNSSGKFTNDHFGFREAVPFNSITGHRGDRLIIDDAISASRAASDAERTRVNETYWSSATTSVNDPQSSTTTIIQQRLHEDDLVGSILNRDSRFEKLILPMEYVPTTYVTGIGFKDPRTEPGELLFPAHWNAAGVKQFRAEGPYKYASQFQQNPVPTTDGYFERSWFQRYDPQKRPANLNLYMSSDHAVGGTDKSDYSVFRIWGIDEYKNLWLIASHRTRDRLTTALGITTNETGQLAVADIGALALVKRYKPLCWFAEPDNNFKATRDMLDDTMRASGVHCRIVYADSHHKSKEEKAQAFQGMASLGKIYLPSNTVGDMTLDEYVRFTVSGHDDQVDADAIIPRMLRNAHAAILPPTPKNKSRDGYEYVTSGDAGSGNWNMFF